jgi:hypothetical protein
MMAVERSHLKNGGETGLPLVRVVALVRHPMAAPAGVHVVCVQSAYEAAAEMLAVPAAALIVDLGMLLGRNLRLLQIARQGKAELLAFGSAAAALDAEQLSGLRLVSQAQLAEAMQGLAPARPEAAAGVYVPQAPAMPADDEVPVAAAVEEVAAAIDEKEPAAVVEPLAARVRLEAPATARIEVPPTTKLTPAHPQVPSLELALEAAEPDAAPPPAVAISPHSLLTPEELSALLGEDEA